MDYPFTSDGCSVVADLDVGMRRACLLHDFRYWAGGTWRDRWRADAEFYRNIWEWSGYRWMACHRWLGVRIGGSPLIPARGVRWGYGWDWPRHKAPRGDTSQWSITDGIKEYERLRREIT